MPEYPAIKIDDIVSMSVKRIHQKKHRVVYCDVKGKVFYTVVCLGRNGEPASRGDVFESLRTFYSANSVSAVGFKTVVNWGGGIVSILDREFRQVFCAAKPILDGAIECRLG